MDIGIAYVLILWSISCVSCGCIVVHCPEEDEVIYPIRLPKTDTTDKYELLLNKKREGAF